jgi:hypothetical protein
MEAQIMTRTELIQQIAPAYMQAHAGENEANITAHLENLHISELQRMYDAQVRAGYIRVQQQPQKTQADLDLEEAKQLARKVANEQLLRERQELLDQQQRNAWIAAIQAMFRPGTILPDRTLVQNQANTQVLAGWENPGEQITNPVEWLKKVLKDNPSLIQQLSWEPIPDIRKQKEEDRQQLQADYQTFLEFCRRKEMISPSKANFDIIYHHYQNSAVGGFIYYLDSSVVELPHGVVLITDDGDDHSLTPATAADIEKFREQKEQLRRQHLRHLAKTDNIAELKRIAKNDHERNTQSSADLAQEFNISKQFEKEQYLKPLPSHWQGKPLDPPAIRAMNREQMRPLVQRFGSARLTARLLGYKSVRRFDSFGNPVDGIYVIEQGATHG